MAPRNTTIVRFQTRHVQSFSRCVPFLPWNRCEHPHRWCHAETEEPTTWMRNVKATQPGYGLEELGMS